MIVFDPHHRIDLHRPWAGISFLGDRLITPEGRELEPQDLAWSIDSSRNVRNRGTSIPADTGADASASPCWPC